MAMKPHSSIPPPEGNGKTLEERDRRVRRARSKANEVGHFLSGNTRVSLPSYTSDTHGFSGSSAQIYAAFLLKRRHSSSMEQCHG